MIPVIDIRQGQAVRAFAGDRDHYGPLASVLHAGTDPVALAKAALEAWARPDLYLADLSAILGERNPALETYRAIAELGLILWVDAGVRSPEAIAPLLASGVGVAILGLETVAGPGVLAEAVERFGPERVAFSLDLKEGRSMVDSRRTWGTDRPEEIAAKAIEAGARRLIRLDLDRVGTGRGAGPLPVAPAKGVEWIAGGGVAGPGELVALTEAGFAGALVGSALHGGRINRADLDRLDLSDRRTS